MSTSAPDIELRDVGFGFGASQIPVIDGLSCRIPRGALWSVFGHNGSGKTTLLNLIAGVFEPSRGEVVVGGSAERLGKVQYVFQDFRASLLPWRSASGNIAFGLEAAGVSKPEAEQAVRHVIDDLGITFDVTAHPHHLSGGQQQLLAYARAFVLRPLLLVLDEPFSALDARSRMRMRDHLRAYWRETGATILVVTHDLDEAIYLGEAVLLLADTPVVRCETVPVDLPAHRTADDVLSDAFGSVRRRILQEYARFQD